MPQKLNCATVKRPAKNIPALRVPTEESGAIQRDFFRRGPQLLGELAQANWLAVLMFLALTASLYIFARKKLE